jgi:hypothetical protein
VTETVPDEYDGASLAGLASTASEGECGSTDSELGFLVLVDEQGRRDCDLSDSRSLLLTGRGLREARRRIPRQAFALKENRDGTSPVSKAADDEDTLPSDGCPEISRVQDSVGPPIPALPQEREEGTKVPSSSRRQEAGDVFEHHPSGAQAASQSKKLDGQVAARIIHAETSSADGEGLARSAADQKSDWSRAGLDLREVAISRNLRVAVSEDGRGERVDLGDERGLPSQGMPRHRGGLDPGANRPEPQGLSPE